MSVKNICEKLGYRSQTTVKNILNKYNVDSNREKEYQKLKNKIREIAPTCLSAYELAKKVGCAPTTARKYIKEFDDVLTFDKEDAMHFGIRFLPFYWIEPDIHLDKNIDVFGFGTMRYDRYILYRALIQHYYDQVLPD